MAGRHAALLAACLTLTPAATGCGRGRPAVPDVSRPAAPGGWHAVALDGIAFSVPDDWQLTPGSPPLVATVSSGSATIALWRYPRSEPLPAGRSDLRRAARRLRAAVRMRAPGIRHLRPRITRLGGVPAIELTAVEQIDAVLRRVHSWHIYTRGIELVLDAYAAPGRFRAVDRGVFDPLAHSVRVGPSAPRAR